MSKVWFITGTSRGFGRFWTEAALKRGDKVAATARSVDSLQDLVKTYGDAVLPIALDVTDHDASFAAVKEAHKKFGRLDVVINNAGYGLFGAIEEASEKLVREQMETNFFGALWVTQAALPFMREQKSGHILQVSSIGGVAAFPLLGFYHASKWALEAFSDSLSQEVAPFGIHVTLVEPGPYDTDWRGGSSAWAEENPAYSKAREVRQQRTASFKQADPKNTCDAIFKIVDSDKPPLRLFLGEMPFDVARNVYKQRLETWADWETVSKAAQ
jgi:NAD(P)-dependent dehydrogenase (short-subunit alcohol dehydrogenase family)